MRHSSTLLALAAAAPAFAKTVEITAGEDNKFSPETVTAEKGDVLEFHFGPKNHSVAMGEFDSINGPCVPANEGGFFSGYFAVDSGESVSARPTLPSCPKQSTRLSPHQDISPQFYTTNISRWVGQSFPRSN